MEVVDLADGLTAFIQAPGTRGRANSALLADGGSAVIIDSMLFPAMAEGIRDELRRRQLKPGSVLNTHPHADHVGGNAAFPEAALLAHPATAAAAAQFARDTSFLPKLFPDYADEVAALEIVAPAGTLEWDLPRGAQALALGPAHSAGDLAVWLPAEQVLVAGDLCFNQVTPLALPGHASIPGWIAALDELIALRPRTVVPGHGPVGDASVLAAMRAYLADVATAAGRVLVGELDEGTALAGLRSGPLAGWAEPGRTVLNLSVATGRAAFGPGQGGAA
jgi:cyclase